MYNDSPIEIIFDMIADMIIESAHEQKEQTIEENETCSDLKYILLS